MVSDLGLPSDDPERRRERVRVLGLSRNVEQLAVLVSHCEDPAPPVRAMATRAIGWLREPRCIAPLLNQLEDSDADVRRWAIRGLSLCGDSECLPTLLKHFKHDEDRDVRGLAARAIGWLKLR